MKNFIFTIWILILISIVGYFVWWAVRNNDKAKNDNEYFLGGDLIVDKEKQEEIINDFKKDTGEVYINSKYNFSFKKPDGYDVGFFAYDESRDIVLLQKQGGIGVQIVISSFDENGVLTESRIRKELPNLDMRNISRVYNGSIDGLSFLSSGEAFGKSAEIWFVYNGLFFQMSTYEGQATILKEIINNFDIK